MSRMHYNQYPNGISNKMTKEHASPSPGRKKDRFLSVSDHVRSPRSDNPKKAQLPSVPLFKQEQDYNITSVHRRATPQRGRNRRLGPSTHGMDSTHHRIKVTRRTTNVLFFMMGMIPSLLLYFGHWSTKQPDAQISDVRQRQDFMKKQFQEEIKPKILKYPEPYSPALLSLDQIDPAVVNQTQVLHFVKSRFMQYQPNLTALGWARLELFREFCMPSVVKQTTQNFVWLIYTDPDLHPELLNAMIDLLKPYPHYYLIKSLSNAMWKGGQAQNMTQATIYTGDRAYLEAYMALRDSLPVLETRLDADDALHIEYLNLIQQQAVPYFQSEGVQWMYWCVSQELEWNWLGPQGYDIDQREYGIMESKPYEDFCPTPGLTLGYAAATPVDSIYTRRHSVLVERLHTKDFDFCGVGRQGKDCYKIIRDFEYPAFRCRTPTSASMVMTDFSKESKLKKVSKAGWDKRWDALRDSFGVPRSNVHTANNYMTKHIISIAEEALMGQCTKGHSCSKNARAKLETVIERYANLAAHEDNPSLLKKQK